MDRTKRLLLEVEDKWTPVFERIEATFARVKERIAAVTTSISLFSVAISLTDSTVGKLLNRMFLFPFTKLGVGFSALSGSIAGFGKGITKVASIIGAEFKVVYSVIKGLVPVAKFAFTTALSASQVFSNSLKKLLDIKIVQDFKSWGQELINSRIGLEQLSTRMNTVFKSFSMGQKALELFTKKAAETPFLVEQITEAVATVGAFEVGTGNLSTMNKYITAIGDTAAAMGRDLNDMAYSFANATTGMMRGLKTVGITSADIQKQLKGEIDTATEYGQRQIAEAVSTIMSSRFGGAMERYMNYTMTGLLSNMKDFVSDTKRTIAADLGTVVLSFLQKLRDGISKVSNMAGFTLAIRNLGYGFAAIAQSVSNTIIPYVTELGKLIINIANDSRFKVFWDSVASIMSVIADVYMDGIYDRMNRLSAVALRIIPYLANIPIYLERAWNWAKAFEEVLVNRVFSGKINIAKIFSIENIVNIWARFNQLLFKVLSYIHTIAGVIKIVIGLVIMFGGLLTGPISSIIGALIVGWGAVDMGMGGAFGVAVSGFAALQKGVRNFLVWLDRVVYIIKTIGTVLKVIGTIITVLGKIVFYALFGPTILIVMGIKALIGLFKKDVPQAIKKVHKDAGPLTKTFDKMSESMSKVFGGQKNPISDLQGMWSNMAQKTNEELSKGDAKANISKVQQELEIAAGRELDLITKSNARLSARRDLLMKQIDLYRQTSGSLSGILNTHHLVSASIQEQIAAINEEAAAYYKLAAIRGGGYISTEDYIKMREYESSIVDLRIKGLEIATAEREQVMDVMDQYSAIYAERVSMYSDDARFQGAKISALQSELSIESRKLQYIKNILRYENLGYLQRLKYNVMLEQQISKVRKLKDEMRGTRDDDWIAQAYGAVRGIENLAPAKGSYSYISGVVQEKPGVAVLTVVVEDRRDLEEVMRDKILPTIDRKLYSESSTSIRPIGGV